ncbi:MAG: phage tail assembly chaperone [Pseudomonadales bacterium]
MAKIKFTLNPNPTFKHKVPMPIPGGAFVNVEFTFKHRGKEEFADFLEKAKDMEDTDLVLSVASGWELEEAFDKDNVEQLVENYVGAARAIFTAYMDEIVKARVGN